MRPLMSAISRPFGQSASVWAPKALGTDNARPSASASARYLVVAFDLDIIHSSSGESSHHFEQCGGSHSAPNAHRDDDVLRAAAASLDQRMTGKARSRHAIRMADRDGAAVDVESLVWNTDLVATVDHLHGECFIQFPQVDVVDLLAGVGKQLRNGEHGADTHFVRLAAGDGETAKDAHRRQATCGGLFVAHDRACRRAV